MTCFVPAYDVEKAGECLEACRILSRLHRERSVPATFFIVGRLLETEGAPYRELLEEPELFEVASHTYSHKMLRDQPAVGLRAAPEDEIRREVLEGKKRVEETFGRKCLGMRPGCGFENGLSGDRSLVALVADAGYRYVSSQLWGPACSMPAPLAQAHAYDAEGRPDLWEFPGHGWHDNVLKWPRSTPCRWLLWPPLYPEAIPPRLVRTVEEEVAVHRCFIERALAEGLEYVSLVWHPWSLRRFDPEMEMPRRIFDLVQRLGMSFARFEDLRRRRD